MLGGLSHVPPLLQTGHRVGTRAASPQCATGMGGDTREYPLAPSSAAGPGLEISSGGWRRCRGVFLQLIPPMPRWGQPALVAASGKGDEEGVRRFLGSLS